MGLRATNESLSMVDRVARRVTVRRVTDRGQRWAIGVLAAAALFTVGDAATQAAPITPYILTRVGLFGADAGNGASYVGTAGVVATSLGYVAPTGWAVGSSNRYVSGTSTSNSDIWAFNPSTKTSSVINLTGGVYENGAGVRRGNIATLTSATGQPLMSNTGQVVGFSNRYLNSSISLGQDAWYFDGTKTMQVGPTGGAYSYTAGTGQFQSSSPAALNTQGQVIVTANRYNSAGTLIGRDLTIETPTATYDASNSTRKLLGLTTGSNSFTDASSNVYRTVTFGASTVGGTLITTAGRFFSNSGYVIGTSARYNNSTTLLGQDAWYYDPNTQQSTGIGYSNAYNASLGYGYVASTGRRESSPLALNESGTVVGFSTRYPQTGTTPQLGRDLWLFNPTTQQYTTIPYPSSTVTPTGTSNANITNVYDRIVTNTAGGGTATPGSTGNFDTASGVKINDNGNVVFRALSYNGVATGLNTAGDTVYFNAKTGTSKIISPIASIYTIPSPDPSSNGNEFRRTYGTGINTLQISNISNCVVGSVAIARNNSGTSAAGSDIWLYNGNADRTSIISLSGTSSNYPAITYGNMTTTIRSATLTTITEGGYVIGFNTRYAVTGGANMGRAGWIYNISTDTTTELQFPSFSNSGAGTTTPVMVTPNGTVYGDYNLYDTSGLLIGTRGFMWNAADGYKDLASLTTGLTGSGFNPVLSSGGSNSHYLISGIGSAQTTTDVAGYPVYIGGAGQLSSGSGNSVTTGVAWVAVVPEPGAMAPLAAAGIVLARRRR
jgi:hypothetical protein